MKNVATKRSITFLALLCVVFAAAAPMCAETLNADYAIEQVQKYYSDNGIQPTSAEEIIVFSSVNALGGKTLPDIWDEQQDDMTNYIGLVFCRLSRDTDPSEDYNGVNPVEYLAQQQNENGSFGTVEQTALAAAALEAAQVRAGEDTIYYSARAAVSWLIENQRQDGAYGDGVRSTGMALSYLSKFNSGDNGDVRASVTAAQEYLSSCLEQGGEFDIFDLSWVIMGLTDTGEDVNEAKWAGLGYALDNFKNSDGTYRAQSDGEDAFDSDASMAAIAAFDAVLNSASWVSKLMNSSSYSVFVWDNLRPYLYVFAVICVLSLIFWGYIMFGRKKHHEPQSSRLFSDSSEEPGSGEEQSE